ncbi:MAG: threonyl-tRNA synthetase editing domain-containing protein [Desulfobacteraceae bacterium]
MRVLFWYCGSFAWKPTIKTIEDYPDADADQRKDVVVAFIHVEPKDTQDGAGAETKLVKNAKWLARKWDVKQILLHSFTHLAEEKAEPEKAKAVLDRVEERLEKAGYEASQTAYGYFNDLSIEAKGHPLARVFKEF